MTTVWTVQQKLLGGSKNRGYNGVGGIAVFSSEEKAVAFLSQVYVNIRIGDVELVEKVNDEFTIYRQYVDVFGAVEQLWGISETEIDVHLVAQS